MNMRWIDIEIFLDIVEQAVSEIQIILLSDGAGHVPAWDWYRISWNQGVYALGISDKKMCCVGDGVHFRVSFHLISCATAAAVII